METKREKSGETTDRRSVKKSSIESLLKSAKTKKDGQSPNRNLILRTPSPENFQDVYQKMIIRTLKYKGKSQQHPY